MNKLSKKARKKQLTITIKNTNKMPFPIIPLAIAAGSAIYGAVSGKNKDKRQIKQQGALIDQQMQADMRMTDYNMGKQKEFWEQTGPQGQMEQLGKAGLNPGLIYGMGGAGGQSSNIETGHVSAAKAPSGTGMEDIQGAQMGLQLALIKAQTDNINADTQDKLANLPVKGETARGGNMANNWEEWKQGHNEEGYKIIEGQAYDKSGNKVEGKSNITWKEGENKMAWDKTFQEIDGILKENAIKDEERNRVKAATDEIGQKIEVLKSQKSNIDEGTKNIKKEGLIKDFEIEMNKVGLTRSSIEKILQLIIHKL